MSSKLSTKLRSTNVTVKDAVNGMDTLKLFPIPLYCSNGEGSVSANVIDPENRR